MPFSWSSILRSLFESEDEPPAVRAVSPATSSASERDRDRDRDRDHDRIPRTPQSTRSSTNYDSDWLRSPGASSVDSEDQHEPAYVPKPFDGEYNVCFQRKPLGLGLVPSTQMYGAWEISSVTLKPPTPARRPRVTHTSGSSMSNSTNASTIFDEEKTEQDEGSTLDDSEERRKISRGDVIIAVNYSVKKAQLPRDELGMYLSRSICPIVVTLRKPEVYGSFDSRSVATAMFPTSTEYHGLVPTKSFHSRATSSQWKRVLQYELETVRKTKGTSNKKTSTSRVQQLEVRCNEGDGSASSSTASSPSTHANADVMHSPMNIQVRHVASPLTPQGEYTYVFTETPLHIGLAPSTRLYGSLEVYDPGTHEPSIEIGDVVMSVNDDSAVSQLPNDEALEYIRRVAAPVTILFRRPGAYRKYLETHMRAKKQNLASLSIATSMFPNTAEYKQEHSLVRSNQFRNRYSSDNRRIRESASFSSLAEYSGEGMRRKDWQDASHMIASTGQFKLYRNQSRRSRTGAQSAFLTERHVEFLYKNLPINLACNKMVLAYDTRQHGWNTLSFFNALNNKGPNLLVIRDDCDNIFGAFSSTSWKNSQEVYGNGRCFVFTLRPHARVYRWSGLDNTFMFTRDSNLFMGGGKKGTALCVQIDEMRGFTHPCDTFDSPTLAPGNETFQMENIEVWCFSGLRI